MSMHPARVGWFVAGITLLILILVTPREDQDSRVPVPEASVLHAPATDSSPSPGAPSEPKYVGLFANLWEGTELYLRTDHAHVGTVTGFDDDHVFEDGTTRDAVRVRYPDGTSDWLPRRTVQRIYVTRR